jgi:hypothetical protein
MRWLRSGHVLMFLVVAGCSGKHNDDFGNNGNGNDGGNGQNGDSGPITNPSGDSGCPFCGTDASSSGGDGGGCSPNTLNFDIPGNGCDDDDNGIVDDPPACDGSLATTGPAGDFAKALGLCTGTKPAVADATHWGVVSATYTQGYSNTTPPDANQHGIMSKFGTNVNPRQGSALGSLSSGYAANQDGCGTTTFKYGCPMTGAGAAPPGYPKAAGSCPIDNTANDVSALVLQIKVPANAKGFAYDFNFYSGEWPEWVCTSFNDSFVAWLTSAAFSGKSGDFNISFDSKGNPVSVNNNFFQACSPANATVGCMGTSSTDTCSLGNSELQGTGFFITGDSACGQSDSGGGATGWLTTQAPAQAGETMTIQFIVWDTGDQAYDSSVLLDNWNWQPAPTSVTTTRPPS